MSPGHCTPASTKSCSFFVISVYCSRSFFIPVVASLIWMLYCFIKLINAQKKGCVLYKGFTGRGVFIVSRGGASYTQGCVILKYIRYIILGQTANRYTDITNNYKCKINISIRILWHQYLDIQYNSMKSR